MSYLTTNIYTSKKDFRVNSASERSLDSFLSTLLVLAFQRLICRRSYLFLVTFVQTEGIFGTFVEHR